MKILKSNLHKSLKGVIGEINNVKNKLSWLKMAPIYGVNKIWGEKNIWRPELILGKKMNRVTKI